MELESSIDGESLVEQVRNELVEIDSMDVNDHAQRYEDLHTTMAAALSSIDGV
ncbi:unannotated protein [freshwater metagenome]|uniref:Unannotated protein n=1 Tax=freshwater metagenome TaxID=449393 RepID=A0A6J6QRC5_9ZZZZ